MTAGRWPTGGGEMARRIREHDWASTPLGPIEGWPQSLKTAVEMVLAMPAPATILWGPEHVQLYNDAYVVIAKDRHPALLGSPAAEGWPDAYEGVIKPLLDAVHAGRTTELSDYPVALLGPDGRLEERVFDTDWSPIRDEGGGVAGALQTLAEVTERKRAEEALRESEERYRLLFENMSEGFALAEMIWDERGNPADWRYLEVNRAWAQTGVPVNETIGRTAREVNPSIEPGWIETYGRVVRTGRPVAYESYASGFGKWFETFAFKHSENRFALLFRDVTERKRAEEALRDSEEQFRTLADTAPALIWRNDAEGENLFVNEYFLDFTGKSAEEVRGEGWHALIHPDDADPYVADYLAAVSAERAWRNRNRIRRHDGTWRWFENYAQPLFDAKGLYAGHVGVSVDTTDQVEAEQALREVQERQAFLLRLSDALRPLADATEIQATTAQLLGTHFGADRAMYAEVEGEPGAEAGIIRGQYVRPAHGGDRRIAPFPERFAFGPFGPLTMAGRYRGEVLVVADVDDDPRFGASERAAWGAADVRAAIVAPLAKGGRLVAEFGVHCAAPRAWTDAEVSLVSETAERTWAAAERARAEEALRASEGKYRTLFESIDEGFCVVDLVRDDAGEVVDYRFVEVNRVFERQTGVENVTGKTDRELGLNTEPRWLEMYGEVARTGEPLRAEDRHESTGRWYQAHVSRVGGDGSRRVAIVFDDITGRKRREADRELLVDVSEDLSRLSDEEEILRNVGAKLAAHLKLDCFHYVDVDEERAEVTVRHFWHALDVPHILGTYPIDGFTPPHGLARMRAGGTSVVNDVQGDLPGDTAATAALKAGAAAQKIGAYVAVPYSQNGRWKAYLAAADSRPRRWTSPEIELIQEVSGRLFPRIERARAEEALRESEERHRLVIEGARDYAIVTTDPGGTIESWSPGAEAVFGWATEEAVGRTPGFTFTPEDREAGVPEEELAVARRDGSAPDVRWHLRKDGSRVFIEGITRALRAGNGGEPRGFLKVGQDVTERRRAEEALRASEERYRTLVENVADHAVFMLDPGGLVTEWTESARRVKGYAAEEVIGRHVSMFYAPEAVEAGDPERELAEAASNGRAEREQWRVKKGGGRIWVDEIATAVRDEEGALVGFTKISRDLTERREAEEALRESRERLRAVVENAPIVLVAIDEDGVYRLAEGKGHEALGVEPGAAVGRSAFEVFRGNPGILEDTRRALAGEAFTSTRELNGALWETTYTPLRDGSGEPAGAIAVGTDVTDRRRAEEERARLRERELAALAEAAERERISRELHDRVAHHMGVAHQSLELHAALAKSAPERAAEKLALARETTRLALDQTRALSAELKRLQEEELSEGIGAALRALPATMSDGVEVDVRSSGDESAVPKPVALQVYLAMREAVRNALRHSGCSRVGVELDVSDGEVVGSVEDDGRGFDPEAVGRASPSWGVGLRSMRERAEMLGGTLRLDSAPGAGTRVEIRVPLDGHRP